MIPTDSSGWVRARLGEVLEVKYGKGLPARSRRPGSVGVYASAGLTGVHDEPLTNGPTLVVGRKGAVGRVTFVEDPCWVIDTAYYLPVPDELNGRFLAYQLEAARLADLDQSTAIPSLARPNLADCPIWIAPPDVQNRVVESLERSLAAVSRGRDHHRAARNLLKRFRQVVLREALERSGEGTLGAPLPVLPRSWSWSEVKAEGEVQLGLMRSPERHAGPDMRPYLRVANVLDDRLDLSDVGSMNFPPTEFERYRLRPGDILLNEGQSPELLGRAAMWRDELPDMCFQKTLIRFRSGPRVNPEFALLVFRHYLYAGRFRRESRITTGIGHLTAVRFAAMEFPVPPLDEQARIVAETRARLSGADALDVSLAASIGGSRVLREAVLKAAFGVAAQLQSRDTRDEAVAIVERLREHNRVSKSKMSRRRKPTSANQTERAQ